MVKFHLRKCRQISQETSQENNTDISSQSDHEPNFLTNRVVPSVDSTKNRRAMLLTRGAVTPADHTVEAMQKQLLAAGINGKLVPQKGGVLNINVLSTMGISEAAAESEARAFLPAHLSLVFDFGKNTWDAQDAAGSSWNVLDLRNKTWNALDVL